MALIVPGTRLPALTLAASDGSQVNLADFYDKNEVVLVFYPANNTPG